jgi:hypothetical protein
MDIKNKFENNRGMRKRCAAGFLKLFGTTGNIEKDAFQLHAKWGLLIEKEIFEEVLRDIRNNPFGEIPYF